MFRFIALFLMASCAASLSAQDWPSIVETYGPVVSKVTIVNNDIPEESGTAFVIGKHGRLLTCAHVVSAAQFDKRRKIQLTFPLSDTPEKVWFAKIEMISDELDLAILSADAEFAQEIGFAGEGLPKMMSEVLVVGYPLGLNFKATPGFIQAFQDVPEHGKMLDLSASVDPGNSGGPVFSKEGKAVGIVTSRIVGHNFNLALPIQNVIDFLELAEHPVLFNVDSDPSGGRVFVNGVYKGQGPLQIRLMNRSAEISIEKDGFEIAKKRVTVDLAAVPDQRLTLVASASTVAKVNVESVPIGAKVWINNSEVGTTPLEYLADKGARLHFRLEASGYQTSTGIWVLTDDPRQSVRVEMKKGWF